MDAGEVVASVLAVSNALRAFVSALPMTIRRAAGMPYAGSTRAGIKGRRRRTVRMDAAMGSARLARLTALASNAVTMDAGGVVGNAERVRCAA
jgi:plasmid stabilization system protein ParE